MSGFGVGVYGLKLRLMDQGLIASRIWLAASGLRPTGPILDHLDGPGGIPEELKF